MRKPPLYVFLAWIALLALVGANLGIAYWPLGPASPAISLAIAAVQVTLVAFALMKLWRVQPMTRIFALTGLFWLLILLGLSGVDYATRPTAGAAIAIAEGKMPGY